MSTAFEFQQDSKQSKLCADVKSQLFRKTAVLLVLRFHTVPSTQVQGTNEALRELRLTHLRFADGKDLPK